MRVFLIFHLLISAAICASLVQQLDGESNFKERPSPVGPEKQNRWSSQVEDLDGIITIFITILLFQCFKRNFSF